MTRSVLYRRILALIEGAADDAARDALIDDLARWQSDNVPPYGRLPWQQGHAPALATDVFRFARVAAHPPDQDIRIFQSSGTTASARSTHPLRDLSLYDAAAHKAAREMLFLDRARMPLCILAPPEQDAPHSSLSYMLSRFSLWFGSPTTWVWRDDALDIGTLCKTLDRAVAEGQPIALLGTSFAFVHAEDALGTRHFALPPGSRLMQTGGFKGRSREVSPQALRDALCSRYGLQDSMVVSEYGMTEMSSQLYETSLRDAVRGVSGPRRLWVPHWVRVTPVDPESLLPVPEGEIGILRIDDCANLDSVCCLQTADLGRRLGDGIELIGRSPDAVPRGCSLTTDIALGRGAS